MLDPRSGYPADHTQAVTILIPPGPKAGTLSDAASKPIFIAGPEHWREMARKMEIGLVLRVDRDNRIFVTDGLRKRLDERFRLLTAGVPAPADADLSSCPSSSPGSPRSRPPSCSAPAVRSRRSPHPSPPTPSA